MLNSTTSAISAPVELSCQQIAVQTVMQYLIEYRNRINQGLVKEDLRAYCNSDISLVKRVGPHLRLDNPIFSLEELSLPFFLPGNIYLQSVLALCQGKKQGATPRPTLVLDLDETLIHTTTNPEVAHEGTITVKNETTCVTGYVSVRPGARVFLEKAAKRYELVIFTASEKDYADKVLNLLDLDRKLIKYRLYRSACVAFGSTYIKDLSLLGRDLAKTIIVDNSLHSFAFQPENGIVIKHFIGDMADRALSTLWGLLYSLAEFPDMRTALSSYFQ